MKNQQYISVQGLQQAITDKIPIEDRKPLYKQWKRWRDKTLIIKAINDLKK